MWFGVPTGPLTTTHAVFDRRARVGATGDPFGCFCIVLGGRGRGKALGGRGGQVAWAGSV